MDLQKNTSPPPIPGPQTTDNPPGKKIIFFAVIGSILVAVFQLLNFCYDFIILLSLADMVGVKFYVQYVFNLNSVLLLILTAGVGGLALGMKKKWGWPLAYGASLFNIFLAIYSLILGVDTSEGWAAYLSKPQIWMFFLSFILSICVVVILSLRLVRVPFKVGSTQYIIGFGIMGFLVLDLLICIYLL